MTLLELQDVSRKHGDRTIFAGIKLGVAAGERMTIIGPSGSGKTSLLRIIAGLDAPDAGTVKLNGRPASEPGRVRMKPWDRNTQMVFQDLGLWPTRTVVDNVADALRARGNSRAAAADQASAALDRVGLAAHARKRPGQLSGGEARRLAFARALALEPDLLLLDEPFASLDPVAREHGLAFLEDVLASTQAAVLLVTHDPHEARALGGSLAVLRTDGLVPAGPAREACATDQQFRDLLNG